MVSDKHLVTSANICLTVDPTPAVTSCNNLATQVKVEEENKWFVAKET